MSYLDISFDLAQILAEHFNIPANVKIVDCTIYSQQCPNFNVVCSHPTEFDDRARWKITFKKHSGNVFIEIIKRLYSEIRISHQDGIF